MVKFKFAHSFRLSSSLSSAWRKGLIESLCKAIVRADFNTSEGVKFLFSTISELLVLSTGFSTVDCVLAFSTIKVITSSATPPFLSSIKPVTETSKLIFVDLIFERLNPFLSQLGSSQ